MSQNLVRLSIAAEERAIKYGGPRPYERDELMHLPMILVGGVPVFDALRMRPDQVEDAEARLNVLAGNVRSVGLRQKVAEFVEAFGVHGLRLQDIGDATDGDHRLVRKYLGEMVDAGRVRVKEEQTRGSAKASARKRYFWIDGELDYEEATIGDGDGPGALRVQTDNRGVGVDDAGIIHHGTSSGYLQCCRCVWCRESAMAALQAEDVSAARRAGGSGFSEGLQWTTLRRVAGEREFERALARGEAMKHGDQ